MFSLRQVCSDWIIGTRWLFPAPERTHSTWLFFFVIGVVTYGGDLYKKVHLFSFAGTSRNLHQDPGKV
jgi:hypothetical protein